MTEQGIVTGYDGSPGSSQALRWAIWEADARHTALAVCLAWAPHYLAVLSEDTVYDIARQRAEEIIEGGLRESESVLGPDRVSPLLARRPAAELLCEESSTAELVVVGSRGHGGVPGLRLGSVAWQLACRAEGPVVIVHGQWVHPNENKGPVVAGTDGSQASLAALALAFREAELRDAPLEAVCALTDAPAIIGGARQLEEDFSEMMTTQEKEHPDVTVIRQVEPGSPREALLDAAEHAQLLVVGSRGRTGFDAMNLGSVAQAMLHYAPCPVAITRPYAPGKR
jgi:nucleotide-binding universal stress UspA family protein